MHPHFEKKRTVLGRAPALAREEVTREMAGFTAMTQKMKAQLGEMLTEHKSIVAGAMEHREYRPARGD